MTVYSLLREKVAFGRVIAHWCKFFLLISDLENLFVSSLQKKVHLYLDFFLEITFFVINISNLNVIFIPPKGKCESTPAGVQLISLDLN